MKRGLFTYLFCLFVGFAMGQANGDYRSRANGNWNQINRWQVFNAGAWVNLESVAAGPYRNIPPTSASGVTTIRGGHDIRVSANTNSNQLVIQSGGRLTINQSRTLIIVQDPTNSMTVDAGGLLNVLGGLDLASQLTSTPCQINGTVDNSLTISITNPALLTFNSGSVYRHLHKAGGIIPLATWNINSTCVIAGLNNGNPKSPANLGQSFGNFTWNTPSMGNSANFSLAGALQTVNGNLTFISTGSTPRMVRLDNGGPGYNLTVGGDFVHQGGTVTLTQSQTTGTNITIGGNLNISGGTLTIGTTNNAAVNILLNGNFQKTAGTIVRGTGSGAGTVRFDGGAQTYTNNANITSAVNFSVENGSNLNLGTQHLSGTGTFNLSTGGTIQVGSLEATGAIQVGTTGGNIRVSGVRTYQSGSDIIYNGAGEQFMASGHPSAPNTTIDNLNNVFLLSNVTVNGALNLLNGVFGLENFTITVGGIYDRTNGFFGIVPGSSIDVEGSGAFDNLLYFNYGDNSMKNFTLNRAGVTVIQSHTDLTINGSFTQVAGNYVFSAFGPRSLTLRGAFSQAVGTSIAGGTDADDTFIIAGSGVLPASINLTGTLNTVTMARSGGTFTAGGAFTVSNLNLRDGTVAPSGQITMATGGTVSREFGTVNAVLLAQSIYNVLYGPAFNVTTGLELPSNTTTLNNLTLNNTFNVTNSQGSPPYTLTLAAPVFVNGSLTITEGTFSPVANGVSIKGNMDVATNGIFQAGTGTVTLNGGSAQSITGASLLTFFNLAVTQAPASSVNINSSVDIQNQIAVTTASTVQAGTNLLRLLSTPTSTANVAALPAGALINGSVIVQRHLPKAVAAGGFFYMGSPVTNSSVPDWNVELPIANAYRWNEPTRKYVSYSLGGSLPSGLGLAVNVSSTATFTTDVRGTLRQQDFSVNVTSQSPIVDSPDGWNLIGNPYASAIDWDNITLPSGIYDAMYITDNFNNSGQGAGIQRVSFVDGVGIPATYNGEIAQGQAFWVKATANTALNFTESAKISATNTQFYREGEIPNVLRIVMEGQGLKDEAVLRIREGATNKFDGKYDAQKFFDDEFKLTTLTTDNIKTAINAIGTGDCSSPVPVVPEGAKVGEYQFSFNGIESFEGNISIVLEDTHENKFVNITNDAAYAFSITEENISSLHSRFRITMSAPQVNTLVKATGSRLCEDNEGAIVTVIGSEAGVQYSAAFNGEQISEVAVGTGANIELRINASSLGLGDNAITVWAASGLCSQAALLESPVISLVGKGEITVVKDGSICNEGTATLTASGAAEGGFYNWYETADGKEAINGQQAAQFVTPVLSKTKTYYVAAVNSVGCEGERVAVKAVVSYLSDLSLTLLDDGTLKSSVELGNQWFLNEAPIDGATLNIVNITAPGIYTSTVMHDGCVISASREVSEIEYERGINVEQAITIYPNPAQDKVLVRVISRNELVKAVIIGPTGVEVESKALQGTNGIKEGEFNVARYASGIYSVRIIDGNRLYIKKIAKVN